MGSISFERVAGWAAIAAGVGGFAYSAAFTTYLKGGSSAAANTATVILFGGGIVVAVAWVGLTARLRGSGDRFAQCALAFGLAAGIGSAIHGAYDLANVVKPPAVLSAFTDGPNPVDPRGLMTFGMAGLAILMASIAGMRTGSLPRRLTGLGVLAFVLLEVVYLGRLVILNPKNPVLLTAAVISGFVVTPLWFVWAGRDLLRATGSDGSTASRAKTG